MLDSTVSVQITPTSPKAKPSEEGELVGSQWPGGCFLECFPARYRSRAAAYVPVRGRESGLVDSGPAWPRRNGGFRPGGGWLWPAS
jgi:hypothetical protein